MRISTTIALITLAEDMAALEARISERENRPSQPDDDEWEAAIHCDLLAIEERIFAINEQRGLERR